MARRPRWRKRRLIIPSHSSANYLRGLSPNSHGSGQGIPVLPQRAHSMISCAMTPFLLKGSVLAERPQLGITLALTGVGATRCMFAPLVESQNWSWISKIDPRGIRTLEQKSIDPRSRPPARISSLAKEASRETSSPYSDWPSVTFLVLRRDRCAALIARRMFRGRAQREEITMGIQVILSNLTSTRV